MSTRVLRKRKQPPSMGTEHRSNTTAKRRKKRSQMDPLQRLNEDIVNIVFSYIPSENLVCMERVNHEWQATVRAWIECFGLRTRFPLSWIPRQASNASVYDHFIQYARREYLILHGRPTEVTRLENVDCFALGGNYVVWSTRFRRISSSQTTAGDEIFWRCLGRTEEGSIRLPEQIPSTQFVRSRRSVTYVHIQSLSINQDGVFFMHLHTNHHQDYATEGRDVVYSPVEKNVLWHHTSKNSLDLGQIIPILIGKRLIYCVKKVQGGYKLFAYDFRSGKLLYRSPKHPAPWNENYISNVYRLRNECRKIFSILQTRNGNELIFTLPAHINSQTSSLQIIDGATGMQIHRITYPGGWYHSIHVDPMTDCIALSWLPPSHHPQPLSDLAQNSLTIIQRFSYLQTGESGPRLSPLSTNVVVFPYHRTTSVVDPLSLTGLSYHRNSSVQGHAIRPTTNNRVPAAAREVLRIFSPGDNPPALNKCFSLAKGTRVTLPPQPEVGGHRRVKLNLRNVRNILSLQFTYTGSAFLETGKDVFILQF